MPRAEFVSKVTDLLGEIQAGLLSRAEAFRDEHTHDFDDLEAFKAFFTAQNADKPEIHGGFARAYSVGGPEVVEMCKKLKVTARCIPLDAQDEPGTCLFTGKPAERKVIFAKSY